MALTTVLSLGTTTHLHIYHPFFSNYILKKGACCAAKEHKPCRNSWYTDHVMTQSSGRAFTFICIKDRHVKIPCGDINFSRVSSEARARVVVLHAVAFLNNFAPREISIFVKTQFRPTIVGFQAELQFSRFLTDTSLYTNDVTRFCSLTLWLEKSAHPSFPYYILPNSSRISTNGV